MNITAGAEAAIKQNNSNMIIQTDLFAKVTSRTNLVLKKYNKVLTLTGNIQVHSVNGRTLTVCSHWQTETETDKTEDYFKPEISMCNLMTQFSFNTT